MIVHVPMFGCGYILLSREIRAYDLLSIAVDEAYRVVLLEICCRKMPRRQGARRPSPASPPSADRAPRMEVPGPRAR